MATAAGRHRQTGQPGIPDLREPADARRTVNHIMTGLMGLAFLIILVPLVLVLSLVIGKGMHAINWQFLTNSTIPANVMPLGFGGMGAAVIGTLETTGFAALIAIPLGVLGAVYINEYGGKGVLARVIAFMSDVMTGVPSIVMGLFIYTIWVLHPPVYVTLKILPVWVLRLQFGGYSGLAGSFALACLMLPIVIRSSYEMLRLVPDSLRQGSYALGATKSRVTLTVVIPAALGGIVYCSPSSRWSRRTRTCSAARPRRCPPRSSPTLSHRTSAPRPGPGVPR
jgi:phosphate transport system permease protein